LAWPLDAELLVSGIAVDDDSVREYRSRKTNKRGLKFFSLKQ